VFRLGVLLLVAMLAVPSLARAQSNQNNDQDRL